MNGYILKADKLSLKRSGRLLLHDLSFTIHTGEHWAIIGPSGTGKTTLLETIAGRHFVHGHLTTSLDKENFNVVYVEQQHHFRNLSNTTNFYYQQRFNASDSEDAITVREELHNHLATGGEARLNNLVSLLKIGHVLDERLIMLSNGENKRLQIAKALLDQPALLLLDNPFTGLDTEARVILESVLQQLVENGIHIIMVTSASQLPSFISHALWLHEDGSSRIIQRKDFLSIPHPASATDSHKKIFSLPGDFLVSENPPFEVAVRMKNVSINYDGRQILDNINWEIRKGERWSLSGPNGAGKSTLLSLINADNPQAYANEIYLFDRRRGTGETIWDIKRNIGYISPELHLHFEQSNTGFEVVASGLFDTIGLFRQVNEEQVALVRKWMELLHITQLSDMMMHRLSNSQQRMILLARALVKNPPFLLLDEPCQGLDEEQVAEFKWLINEVCVRGNKTLVYVSHYTQEIPECVDRFARIENGRFV